MAKDLRLSAVDDPTFEVQLGMTWESISRSCFLHHVNGLAKKHSCSARVISLAKRGERLRHLVEIRGEESMSFAHSLALSQAHMPLQNVSRTHSLAVIETPICPLYRSLTSTPCFLFRETMSRGYMLWDLVCESLGCARTLARNLARKGASVSIVRLEKTHDSRNLTDRQREVLEKAFELGYFESPHKTSIKDLAMVLGCSPSTVVRTIRRAEGKILEQRSVQLHA